MDVYVLTIEYDLGWAKDGGRVSEDYIEGVFSDVAPAQERASWEEDDRRLRWWKRRRSWLGGSRDCRRSAEPHWHVVATYTIDEDHRPVR